MPEYVIGLDFGGGGARSLLLDVGSGETTLTSRRWRLGASPGTGGLAFDLDLDDVWRRYGEVTREALARADVRARDVRAVAATSTRHGSVLVDAAGDPVLAVPNRDARAVGPGLTLAAEHGEPLYRATGRWPLPVHLAARLQWLAATRPRDLARVACALSIGDWLAFRMCGETATDPTQAAESLLLDLATERWSKEWIDRLGLDADILPPLVSAGTRLGSLRPDAAEHLGLAPGTPVVVGGGDSQCALLAGGAVAAGDAGLVAGSTGPVQLVVDAPTVDAEQRVWTDPHVVPGLYALESNSGSLGEALEWLARVLHPRSPQPVARLLGEARQSPPGARGLLSSLGADVMNARAMSLPVGHVTLSHLTSADDPAPGRHLARAVVEGMACGLRANLEQVEDVAGRRAASIVLVGGLARSGTFGEIVCDMLDRPLAVGPAAEASALGAALCAAVGAGLHPDLATAARSRDASRTARTPAGSDAVRAVYPRWFGLRSARAPADAEASAMALPFALGDASSDVGDGAPRHRPRVLVAADFDDVALARLESIAEVAYEPYRKMGRMLKDQALVEVLADYDVFVTEIDLVDVDSVAALPRLRVVASCRGDAVNVDVDACTAFGIPVLNTPGRNADAVADLAVAFMLMLARKLPEAERFLHVPDVPPGDLGTLGRAFATLQGRELWRKTVGLVGLGAVGRKVADRLQGFGVRVLAFDPFVDPEGAALSDVEAVSLATLLAESDFVSLHAAVTPDTTGLIGADELAAMKPEACLVNTARAALVDEPALVDALDRRAIAGAALDTFSVEPPGSDHPLMAMEHVISTPHIGGNTVDVAAHQGEIVVDDLERLLAGRAPRHALNPAVLPDFSFRGPRPMPSEDQLDRLREGPAPAVSDLQKKPKDRKT